MAAIRYLTKDVDRSIAFYTEHLGFKLDHRAGPAFASISKDDLILWLSGPGSSGARPMPDGRRQEPGGWNRFVVEMENLAASVSRFRSDRAVPAGLKTWSVPD